MLVSAAVGGSANIAVTGGSKTVTNPGVDMTTWHGFYNAGGVLSSGLTAIGSVNPTTYRGNTIDELTSRQYTDISGGGAGNLSVNRFCLEGNHIASPPWNTIKCYNGGSLLGTLTRSGSTATYDAGTTSTYWDWTDIPGPFTPVTFDLASITNAIIF